MSDLQIVELDLDGTPALLRVYEIELEADAPTVDDTLEIMETVLTALATGTAPTLTAGPVTPTVPALPGTTVSMTVVPGGGAYTSMIWTLQLGSLAVNLSGTDTTKTFIAPYDLDGGTVEYAVVASNSVGSSNPVMLSVDVVPHSSWYLSTDLVWKPSN